MFMGSKSTNKGAPNGKKRRRKLYGQERTEDQPECL